MKLRYPCAAMLAAFIALAGCRAEPAPVESASPDPDIAAAAAAPAPAPPTAAQSIEERVPVTVRTASGATHVFTSEVARTLRQQEVGMMFRESMAPDAGMLFVFERPRYATFWMENTLIPLDIVFIRGDGSIINIAANAPPRSRAVQPSLDIAAAVLEIPGGRAAELGIAAGDRVSWPGGPQ